MQLQNNVKLDDLEYTTKRGKILSRVNGVLIDLRNVGKRKEIPENENPDKVIKHQKGR